MQPVIVFPDTAAAVIAHLNAVLAANFYGAVPTPRPDTFGTVQRLGGPRRSRFVDEAQLGVECWAPTAGAAHDLAQLARAHINSLPGSTVAGVRFYRVTEAAGPADLPDPLSGQPRFVFTVLVAARAS